MCGHGAGGKGGGDELGEWHWQIHTTLYKIVSGKLLNSTRSSAPCSVMTWMGGMEGGREIQEGGYICKHTVDSLSVWQKLTQHCKANILQLKKKKKYQGSFKRFPPLVNIQIHCDWISSVQFSHLVMSDSLQPHGLQHSRLPCPSPTPEAFSNSWPLSRWYDWIKGSIILTLKN